MDAYHKTGARRAVEEEVRAWIERRTSCTPVYGLSEIVEVGDAVVGGPRVAGFMETHDLREWILPLSARKPLSWKTQPVPGNVAGRVCFAMSVGFGNGSPLPQPSGWWDVHVNGRFAVSIRVVNHDQLWRAGPCEFAFTANRIETAPPYAAMRLSSVIAEEAFAAFGPALLAVPSEWLAAGRPAEIRVEAHATAPSARWFQLAAAPSILVQADVYRAADLLAGDRPKVGPFTVYFGDIHTHSGQVLDDCGDKGCGMGSREDNYRFARGPGGLDFYALTDHEWQIGPAEAAGYLGLAEEHTEEGRFVCLPAFEFTSLLYGHRNVYFRGPGGTVINANRRGGRPSLDPADAVTPPELWAALEKTGAEFLTVPHHSSSSSHPCTWDFWDARHDRLVEVYSVWGSSEYYGDFPRGVSDRFRTLDVRNAIRRGRRFGLIASADAHDGHGGDAQSPLVKHHHQFHFCGSGRAAVLAEALTGEAVFDALRDRRCYATTGPPIVLDVRVAGAVMGRELPALDAGRRPVVTVRCRGANGLDHVRIVKNAEVVHVRPCGGEHAVELEWEDPAYDPSRPSSYYVRVVQADRESAWSSPVWIG